MSAHEATVAFMNQEEKGPICAFCGDLRFVDQWAHCFPGKHYLRCCQRCRDLADDREMECCLCELKDQLWRTEKKEGKP